MCYFKAQNALYLVVHCIKMSYYCQSGFGKKINNLDEIYSLSAIQFCIHCLDVVNVQKILNIFGIFFAAALYHLAAAAATAVDTGIYLF